MARTVHESKQREVPAHRIVPAQFGGFKKRVRNKIVMAKTQRAAGLLKQSAERVERGRMPRASKVKRAAGVLVVPGLEAGNYFPLLLAPLLRLD